MADSSGYRAMTPFMISFVSPFVTSFWKIRVTMNWAEKQAVVGVIYGGYSKGWQGDIHSL